MLTVPFRFPLVRALLALMLLSATGWGASKGVVIYKDQPFLADEFAQAVEYEKLEEFPNIFHLTTAQNEELPILTGKILKNIRYPDRETLAEIIEPRELVPVSSAVAELSAAARQYPKASKILEPHIRQLQEIVDRIHKGEAILGGVWLPSKEAAIKLKKEREAAMAAADAEDLRQVEAQRLAREKLAAEERAKRMEQRAQLEKESLRKQEDAKAAEAKRKLMEESQAAEAQRKDEEQRLAAEKQALDGRHIEYASRKMREADRFTEEFDRPVSTAAISMVKLPEGSGAKKAEERAATAAQTIVRKELRAPATAKFQEARILQQADPWYQVFVAVDAQNAVGDFKRGTFVCTLKLGGGDDFTYDQSLGVQKMDEDAIKRDGVLEGIRAACGWKGVQAPPGP